MFLSDLLVIPSRDNEQKNLTQEQQQQIFFCFYFNFMTLKSYSFYNIHHK